MKRTITVKGRTGLFDIPSFTLSDNEGLTIEFAFPQELRAGRYLVVVRHGNAPRKVFVLSEDKTVDLPAEWLNTGGTEPIEFSVAMQNVSGTAVVKNDYAIEPLTVTKEDGNFTATAMLQDMQKQIDELKTALANEIAVKQELLAKLKDYADNGAEVVFE